MKSNFEKSLKHGQAGESAIANWLKSKGFNILPVYDKIIDTGKGPQIFTASNTKIVAPDLLCFSKDTTVWIEAKRKSGFAWYRKTKQWVTGIDLVHYLDYLKLLEISSYEVVLCFIQEGKSTKDDKYAKVSHPSGLYCRYLKDLKNCENHRSDKYGKGGMVYWAESDLLKKAELKDLFVDDI